jgi:Protein of unknown function (DUF1475)
MSGLKLLFGGILVAMLAVTTWASLDRSVFEAGNLLEDPWGVATLADAYFGFVTFYAWLAWRERRLAPRVLWFVLIMCLGNMAMASYMLWRLYTLPAGAGVSELLLGPHRGPASAPVR